MNLAIPPEYGIPFVSAVALAVLGYLIQLALKRRPAAPTIPEMWKRIDDLEKARDEDRKRIGELEKSRYEDKRLMALMNTHITDLEARIPNPPGPPPRPWVIPQPGSG